LAKLLLSPEALLREAAAQAFVYVKSFDEDASVALVATAFGADATASGRAFSALGATEGKDNEGRIDLLPNGGAARIRALVLHRLEAVLADGTLDLEGSRRRHGAELLRRNVPTDGATLARLAALWRRFPASGNDADVHARAKLLSAIVMSNAAEIDYAQVADPSAALSGFLDVVTAATPDERLLLEAVVQALRPTPEALLATLEASTGENRRLLVLQIAGYSGGRLQRLTGETGADAILARCFDDDALGRLLLEAFARHRRNVTLRHNPLLVARIVATAGRTDTELMTPTMAMERNAALVLHSIATVRGRHWAFPDGPTFRPLRRAVLLLADNAEAPTASRAAAEGIRTRLQDRTGGVDRCAEEIADEA